jgi:hypothetical protein
MAGAGHRGWATALALSMAACPVGEGPEGAKIADRSLLIWASLTGISILCIASPYRGLPFKYEPQGRRSIGGIGRRHRRTVRAAGQLGALSETGVVRRLEALRGPQENYFEPKEDSRGDRRYWTARPSF